MGLIWKEGIGEKVDIKLPPRAYVDKVEKWCLRNNAQTVGYKKNIDKHLDSKQAKFLIEFLEKNKLKDFTIKELIKLLEAENFTNGSLQRTILSLLTCRGLIQKEKTEYENKEGKIKFKILYSTCNKEICPYLINKKCQFEWEDAEITKYFNNVKE